MIWDGTEIERARCMAIAIECLKHGHCASVGKEFADGYSVACQEIAGEIQRGEPEEAEIPKTKFRDTRGTRRLNWP